MRVGLARQVIRQVCIVDWGWIPAYCWTEGALNLRFPRWTDFPPPEPVNENETATSPGLVDERPLGCSGSSGCLDYEHRTRVASGSEAERVL